MSKQVYARIDSEKTIAKIAKECKRRGISRPDFVREAVELHLNNNDWTDVVDARDKAEAENIKLEARIERETAQIERLSKHNTELDDVRKSLISQRNKFKQKFEEAVQTNEKLISEVREMQSSGVFARASKLKRFSTVKYVIQTEEDNEKSA